MPTKKEDKELLQEVLSGNTKAFEELVVRYKHYVYTTAFRVVGRHEDAEEVVQDAFVKAYRSLSKFDGRAKFSTWLYRIALNTAISKRRKNKFHQVDIDEHEYEVGGFDQRQNLEMDERSKYIQMAMNEMLEDDVTMLTLFYMQELSLEEIAETTGFEANNVKVKLFRARKRMAEKMRYLLKDEVNSLL